MKLVVAKADQIKERLVVVDWVSWRLHFKFAHRCKHTVPFEASSLAPSDVHSLDSLGKGKVDQVEVAVFVADVVRL